MTRRAPGFAGRWRITEMDEWDEIDLLGSAHITFTGKDGGELVFIASCGAPFRSFQLDDGARHAG